MKRSVLVRLVDSGGRPVRDERVTVEIHAFMAGGMKTEHTNSDGEAEFTLDTDQYAECSVYVKDEQKIERGSIKADYRVVV